MVSVSIVPNRVTERGEQLSCSLDSVLIRSSVQINRWRESETQIVEERSLLAGDRLRLPEWFSDRRRWRWRSGRGSEAKGSFRVEFVSDLRILGFRNHPYHKAMTSNQKSQVNKKSVGVRSRDKRIVDSPDCLPNGWKVEFKYRKSGSKEGVKYKCYVDPVTGCKFYSMKDVARYLNTKMLSNHSEGKDSVNDLPPGWVKEVKVRKTGGRKDPYYSHPESEYIFRSKMDVLRYVEFGTIGRLAFKRKKEDIGNVKVEECTSAPGGAKRQKLSARARGRRLFTKNGSGDGGSESAQVLEPNVPKADTFPSHNALDLGKNVQISEPVVSKGGVPPSNDASELGGDCADLNVFISVDHKDSKEKQTKTDCAESKAELDRSLDNGVGKRSEMKTSRLKRKNNEKALTTPRRSSERLAAIRVGQPTNEGQSPKVGTSHQIGRRVAVQSLPRKADQTVGSAKGCKIRQSKASYKLASATEADSIGITESGNVPELNNPLGAEEQSNICENGQSTRLEPTNEFGKLDGILVPCGLEGERADGKPESPLISPFGDSWPDPCLEFAFKTLTGAIPMDEMVFEDYLKVQLNSNNQKAGELTQPGFVADGTCRTNHFKLDDQVNPSSVPDMNWNPTFSTSNNEPKLNYGNSIFQWDGERKK
ncbi:hypothetical protein Sjap_020610 [Stephania japonica]|uniref:MBD domain-containing protein n=1 Tax=Stephania japonica TaxID=461633 RepID=A0AAP0F106_9MAGN